MQPRAARQDIRAHHRRHRASQCWHERGGRKDAGDRNVLWTIVAAVISAVWVVALFIRDRHSSAAAEYFRTDRVLQDEIFYKAKSFAYLHINLFDELLSLAKHSKTGLRLLMPPSVIELSDWQEYIKRKLRHPLYRSILNNESEIFGAALRDFWSTIRKSGDTASPSPFVW